MWPPPAALYEAWRLALDYTNLVLLRLLDYQGEFGTCLHREGRFPGHTSPVPWSKGNLSQFVTEPG